MTLALVLVIFPLSMAYAAFSDLVSMTIENRVSALLVVGFLCVGLLVGLPPAVLAAHVGVGLACLLATFGMFALGWMGGGDAKLIAATAVWFGPTADLGAYAMSASLYGGALTLALLVARAQMLPVTGVDFVDRLLERETGVPYGIALGAGGLTTFTTGAWMKLALQLG